MESYFFCDFCLYNVKNKNPLSVTGMSKILLRPARACSRPLSWVLLGYSRQKCHPSTAAGLGRLLQCCSHCSRHHVLGVMGVSPQQGRCASAWVGYQHLYLWRCIQNRCRTKQLYPPLHHDALDLDSKVACLQVEVYLMLLSAKDYVWIHKLDNLNMTHDIHDIN